MQNVMTLFAVLCGALLGGFISTVWNFTTGFPPILNQFPARLVSSVVRQVSYINVTVCNVALPKPFEKAQLPLFTTQLTKLREFKGKPWTIKLFSQFPYGQPAPNHVQTNSLVSVLTL